jgi:glycolate oxidase iron-sulfur subunit
MAMVRALGDGRGGFSPELVKHLDQCLGCLACEVACPSGVVYGHALEEARETIEAEYERAPADRVMRWLLEHLFPYPRRLGWALHALYAYQRFGVSRAVRASGILRALSARVTQMESLLPAVPSPRERRPLPEVTLAARPRRGRAGFLTGCAQRFLLPGLNRATVRVLAAAGYDVVTPPTQGCCGALHAHGGHLGEARSMARAIIETFEGAQVDLGVANAAGCGAAMKQYGRLLRDDAAWHARATLTCSGSGITFRASTKRRPGSIATCSFARDVPTRSRPVTAARFPSASPRPPRWDVRGTRWSFTP